MRGMMF